MSLKCAFIVAPHGTVDHLCSTDYVKKFAKLLCNISESCLLCSSNSIICLHNPATRMQKFYYMTVLLDYLQYMHWSCATFFEWSIKVHQVINLYNIPHSGPHCSWNFSNKCLRINFGSFTFEEVAKFQSIVLWCSLHCLNYYYSNHMILQFVTISIRY